LLTTTVTLPRGVTTGAGGVEVALTTGAGEGVTMMVEVRGVEVGPVPQTLSWNWLYWSASAGVHAAATSAAMFCVFSSSQMH